jgi:tRNA A-37 threonylcarbamoyl transferase component Bud32
VISMKKCPAEQFTWFVKDESIFPVVRDIVHPEGDRRSYHIRQYRGSKVFIKTFSEKGAVGKIRSFLAPRGKKEYVIADRLNSLGVPSPTPLGYAAGQNVSAIVETCIDGKTLLDIFTSTGDRAAVLIKLAHFLRFLKTKKVRHDDLHLDNILVSGDTLYLIDLHKVRIKAAFTEADEITNVTHALGTIYYDMDPRERILFFNAYETNPMTLRKITDAVKTLRDTWVSNKMARSFRDTSIVRRKGTRFLIREREGSGSGKFVETLKKDKKVRVERYGDHVRKTYTGIHRLKTAWRNHVVLEYMRKAITPAVYYAEVPKKGHGFIAMEDLTGRGEELDRHLDRNYDAMDTPERISFITELAGFFLGALAWGISHRDLKACNIFVLTRGGFLFLDVEDIQFEHASPETLKKLFCQLNNTVPKRISIKDRIRFFLRLVSLVDCDKKQLFREVIVESLKDNIVYEGVAGLVVESWKGP